MSIWFVLLVLSAVGSITHARKQNKLNDRPIIAVLTQLLPGNKTHSYIAASYVKYLESAGARVVPIPHFYTPLQIKDIFQHVNGVLLPGGGASLIASHPSFYYKHGKQLFHLALKANDNGIYIPVWGTCLGFQAIHVFQADSTEECILSRRVASDLALPLRYTSNAETSKLFRPMSRDLYDLLAKEGLTYNSHHQGISRETYNSTPLLKDFFKVLSTNVDVKGKEFISTVEGKFCFIKRVAKVIVDGVENCLNDIFIYLTFITTLQG